MAERRATEFGEGFFVGPLPRVLAHRGLATDAPENTLLAFFSALAIGVTHLETDVHASADGIAVISHDPDLARTAGIAGRVEELTFAELQEVDLGHGQTYPSLEEALVAFPEARFNIDLKSDAVVRPAVEAILSASATHRVLVTSFDNARRLRAVRALPGVATSASAVPFAGALFAVTLGLVPLARRLLRDVQAVQVPERVRGIRVITARTVRLLKRAGVEVQVWTVNEPDDMRRLLDLGVDGLITDRADLALRLLKARSGAV
ncbi:glycerophosphodiester phosphodiesterase [Frigoribacterium sp. UYMn621]|uniref:glycerophosphodiester phosphodiesterase n=1 Tax=Frigoribacterium sp. UYMn621 TaxID=3156343 RepID=UPI003390EF91